LVLAKEIGNAYIDYDPLTIWHSSTWNDLKHTRAVWKYELAAMQILGLCTIWEFIDGRMRIWVPKSFGKATSYLWKVPINDKMWSDEYLINILQTQLNKSKIQIVVKQ